MKRSEEDLKNQLLPRLVADLTVEVLGDELMLFREYGKDVVSLDPNQTRVYDLCQQRVSYPVAMEAVGRESLFESLGTLREARLLEPAVLPRVNRSQWVSAEVVQERLVYDSGRGKAILLDAVSEAVWEMCDGTTTTALAVADLTEKFELEPVAAEEVLWAALGSLREEGLLVSPLPKSLTRREFVHKWATAAALFPVLTGVFMPRPAAASSGECIVNGDAGCAARFPGGRVNVCCNATSNATGPCVPFGPPGFGNASTCTSFYNIDGGSCLDDSLISLQSNTISVSPRTTNAQTNCAIARAEAINVGFTNYECCECP